MIKYTVEPYEEKLCAVKFHATIFVTVKYLYLVCCLSGLLPSEELQNSVTPPSSPSQILKETDNQWLNSEVSLPFLFGDTQTVSQVYKPGTSFRSFIVGSKV
jgi:hypothetical protein